MAIVNPEKAPVDNGVLDVLASMRLERKETLLALDAEAVAKEFNLEEDKATAAKVRKDTAQIKGIKVDPAIIDKAVDMMYEERFVFYEPPAGLRTRLMDLYINRVNVLYKPMIAIASILAAVGIGIGSVNYLKNKAHEASLNRQERAVERTIDDLFQARVNLQNQMKEISTYISEKRPVESSDLDNVLTIAGDQIKSTDGFFERYKPTEKQVTRENFAEAGKTAATVETTLAQVSQQLSKGKDIIAVNDGLVAVKQGLDSLLGEVKSAKPVDVLMDKANTVYQSGVSAVNNRQLKEAQGYRQQLSDIKTSAHQFASMPAELDKAYQAVVNVVAHEPTKQWAEKMYADGKTYVKSVDIPNLKQTTQDLSDKAAILAQEYEVFIVRQDGRTVWDIEWYETKNGREKVTRVDFFARAQAKKNGRTIPVTFYDVGKDKTVTTETFGYRISGDELGGVSDEAMMEEFRNFVGSGKYQKVPLAVKVKGYPEEEPKYNSSSARKVMPFTDKTSMVPSD